MRLINEKWLLNEFDMKKNNNIDPNELTYSSNQKVWWKCAEGHEWQAIYASRSKKKSGCPYCAGLRAIPGVNDLETEYPELIVEWDFFKNDVDPSQVKSSSGKKIWWKCAKGHEWLAVINTRTKRKYKCPYCSGAKVIPGVTDFATLCPDLTIEWDAQKNNNLKMSEVGRASHKEVWWLCKKAGHSYKMEIQKRTSRGYGCPYCVGRYVIKGENDLETLKPDLLAIWNYEKNNVKPSECSIGSGKIICWKCNKGHEWEKAIIQQVKYNFCPYCKGRKLIVGQNDVLSVHPNLESIWDYEKNQEIPSNVKFSSNKKVWWKCAEGHSWSATMLNVAKGKGCPYCAGKLPVKGVNDLKTLEPELVEEWNYSRNITLSPNEVSQKSNKKVWWICKEGHEWKASISERTNGCGCPICNSMRYKKILH